MMSKCKQNNQSMSLCHGQVYTIILHLEGLGWYFVSYEGFKSTLVRSGFFFYFHSHIQLLTSCTIQIIYFNEKMNK